VALRFQRGGSKGYFFFSNVKPNEPFLDLPEDDDLSTEKLDLQVQKAQEQLLVLKRQQDQIEKQKRDLEELSRRQDQLQQGKAEMVEKFTRASVVLDRETQDAERRLTQLNEIHDAFSKHLQILDSINPRSWEGNDLTRELSKALSAVDDARSEYNKCLPKIQVDAPSDQVMGDDGAYGPAGEHDFLYWLRSGFAFTLPLSVLGAIYIVVRLLH